MTHDEIIEMAQECRLIGMRPHLDGIYSEALVAFAELVEDKALAEHAMREVQRLGQEIEQEPLAWMNPDEQNARKAFHWVNSEEFSSAVYSTPPQRTEQNFCPRCGKRTKDIHTCTPPKETT